MFRKVSIITFLLSLFISSGCSVTFGDGVVIVDLPTPQPSATATRVKPTIPSIVLPTATPSPTPTFTPEPTATPTDTPVIPTSAISTQPPAVLPTSTLPPFITPTATATTASLGPNTPIPQLTATAPLESPAAEVSLVSSTGSSRPTVREDSLVIDTFDYQSALMPTSVDDPVYPYPRLDHNNVGPPSPQTYRTIILENGYTQLTILPDLGGRIYKWIDKNSGENLFYENPVIKPTSWGHRGWWLAAGGMEWTLPTDEHGLNEASPWSYTMYQGDDSASVTLNDTEENSGLVSEINISLDAQHAYFTLTPRIVNPTAQSIPYKFWINGMFDLGSDRPGQEIRFVLPGEQVTVHSTGDGTLPGEGELMSWPEFGGKSMDNYSNWQNYLGVFAAPQAQDSFMGAYNRQNNVGVARVFPHQLMRGAKIFGPADLDPDLWTTDNSSYFELWGGLAPTFWDEVSLGPGEWVTWQERWYAVGDMGGFSYANDEAALNLGLLTDSVQVAAATTHPINGSLVLWHNGQEATRWPLTIYPEKPFRGSFSSSAHRGGEWGLSLFDRSGQELAAMGSTQAELPDPSAQPGVIPASANLSANAPAAAPAAAPKAAPAAPAAASVPAPAPTANPSPTPTAIRQVPLNWDERLSSTEIDLIRAQSKPDEPTFRLVSAKYLNEWEAAGLHHVFVEVLDEQGERIVGQPVTLSWRDGQSKMVTEDKPYPEYAANAPLYGSKEDGTYKVYVDGGNSDVVTGLGLPEKHHVSYQLTFQRGVETTDQPAPAPTQPANARPTSTPVATPGGNNGNSGSFIWDPRLDALGIKLTKGQPKPNQPLFRLVSAKYQDDSESGGMHHVFVEVLDENKKRMLGQPVTLAWADGKSTMVTEDKPYPEYAANAPLFGPMDKGTYKVYVDGGNSDIITGLGLPGNHHVNYLLTFQRKGN